MGTDIRPEVSKNNPYWIPKERYFELKHFCQQYPIWREKIVEINHLPCVVYADNDPVISIDPTKPVEILVEKRQKYWELIDIVEDAAFETTGRDDVAVCLLEGITTGKSYDILEANHEWMPCSRNEYYELYRRFFYILDKKRG